MGWGDADANDRAMAQALEDTGKTLMLRADMPGVKERDVTLSLQRNVLSLTVRRGIERPEGFRAHRQERAEFERTWTMPLPARVDPDKVKATLTDGQLCVVMEKALEELVEPHLRGSAAVLLGHLARAEENYTEALSCYRQATDIDGNNQEANRWVRHLRQQFDKAKKPVSFLDRLLTPKKPG
jgi:HSP20 family molecular chaperone IbpA